MEIITRIERPRRWRLEEKLRIVVEVEQPGVSFVHVARRYEVSRCRHSCRCRLRRIHRSRYRRRFQAAAPPEMARVETALPDGTCIRAGADVGLATLRRVMTAVRRIRGDVWRPATDLANKPLYGLSAARS